MEIVDTSAAEQTVEQMQIRVEARLKPAGVRSKERVDNELRSLVEERCAIFTNGKLDLVKNGPLSEFVESVRIVGAPPGGCSFFQLGNIHYHLYALYDEGPEEEVSGGDESTTMYLQWMLPAVQFEGLWESLIFDESIKDNLVNYVTTSLLFSRQNVDLSIISWNHVVLLYGPPGTGKTSLCKALAHKLAIRLQSQFSNFLLLEINAHSLFSKWFSESGKMVGKLFEFIQDLVEDKDNLVCILIDEVESLAAARQAKSGSEPSDAIRVVNALLTQLDQLKTTQNVIILTTSNITKAIDVAFVDRADIKQYIGLPSPHARLRILLSCIEELMRVGIITEHKRPFFDSVQHDAAKYLQQVGSENQQPVADLEQEELMLLRTVERSEGFSGRLLRKLPFQAHAFYVRSQASPLAVFLRGLLESTEKEQRTQQQFHSG